MEKEIWKELDEFYEVSNLGRVLSKKYKIPRILKPDKSSGYFRVRIYNKWIPVHKLVCKLFVVNLQNKKYVNHIDEDKLNNHFSNLEWVTHRENLKKYHETKSISKHSGIHWIKRQKSYQCSVWINRKKHYLGTTKDIDYAKKLISEFSINNNI